MRRKGLVSELPSSRIIPMSSPEMLKSILLLLSVSKEREQRDHKGPPNLGTGLGLC